MKHFGKFRWAICLFLIGWFILAFGTSAARSASSQPAGALQQDELDLSGATIVLDDLPEGFEPIREYMLGMIDSTLPIYQLLMFHPSPMYGVDDIVNLTGFQTQDILRQDLIYIWLVPSLSQSERNEFDQAFANPDEFIQRIQDSHNDDEAHELPGYENIGNTHLAYTHKLVSLLESQGTLRYEYVIVRRGPVLIELEYHYRDGDQPLLNTIELARILDDRVAAVVGTGEVAFRSSGPLVPELTTYIPTPLDVSPRPEVIGTNLLLAALMMLPFTVAAEFFTRTLAENEETLKRRFRPVNWLSRLQERLVGLFGQRLGKTRFGDVLKVIGVMLFYGLVFSLLDKTWKPFSVKGLVLFFSMTIAYGLVGIADDILQWRSIRKWGLPADLTVRPTNFLLALVSTATTRIISLVPGLMFGTPEALHTDEESFSESQRNTLLKISAITFTGIGLAVWLSTIATGLLQKLSLPDAVSSLIGGLEAFLLVIFAVAMENTFVQMLGFTGGFGQALKKKNRWLWLGALVCVTFIFLHTLLNPRGELAQAMVEGNVLLFLSVVAAFVLFTFGMRLYFRVRDRRTAASGTLPALPVTSAPAAPSRAAPPLTTVAVTPVTEAEKGPVIAALGGERQCPICSNTIKSEAKLCRFCRATFTVTVRGYCLTDHEVVEVTEARKCTRCGGEPADLHVESRLLQAPSVRPARAAPEKPAAPVQAPAAKPAARSDTRQCPACGQTIKAEAKICRYCRTMLDARAPTPAAVEQPVQKPGPVVENKSPQKCPKCSGDLSERSGSPVSPYINTYTCSRCGWVGFRCGETGCDGYLKPQEAGYPNSVRYNCVKCGWTGMGPRVRLIGKGKME
jgi:predicted RNA-binding Zn-ribbon protein involved in translation (DUF1610 family)